MDWDSVEQKLAKALPDIHLLAPTIVGKGVDDDCDVVFVDNVVLGVGGGEDNRSAHDNLGAKEGWGGYILVVDQGFVDSIECGIGDDLAGNVVLFGVDGCFGGGGTQEVARNLMFDLGIHGQDEFGYHGLPSLALLPQTLPSFDIGGMCGMFSW